MRMKAFGQIPLRCETATPDAALAIAALRTAVALNLTTRYGRGHWSLKTSAKGALFGLRTSLVRVVWRESRLVATFALATKKPWAIDRKYFSACAKPLYLTNMAVDPELQRQGIGRLCIEDAKRIARAWPSDAIRLDAYDAEAGDGDFYAKSGFREVGRVAYKGTPLVYFEMLLCKDTYAESEGR
ncbi:MAG TPA: GNAT family N-acetyltransferase [Thermoanaerobaculia bacterium]|nr:GNAT family N-acetyltransferase [Thermoanaerobaculia bacterium]